MTPRQARIGVDLFTALVVASVGVALAGLTWRLLGDPGMPPAASPMAAAPAAPVDIAPLIALAPFGNAPAAGGYAQATGQPLVLRGIVLAQPRSASSALISIGDAAPVAFYAGQAVGNATIDAIEVDHVVLLSGGARTVLAFPKPAGGVAGPVAGTSAPPPMIAQAAPPPVAPAAGNGPGLLGSLGATPSGAGLAVSSPSTAMRMAGLQPGDQIVAINGAPAIQAMASPALLQPLIAAGTARIDVVRAGQRLTLSVPLR